MNTRVQRQTKAAQMASFVPVSSGLLQRKCACGTHTMNVGRCAECQKKQVNGKPLQTKLAISEPGDAYEQEADRVAEQVIRMPAGDVNKRRNGGISRLLVQRRTTGGPSGLTEVPPIVHEVLSSSGHPLDPATRAFFEPRFGHDFSHMRVHADAKAAESARVVNAIAYTVGRDLVFGSGGYAPRTIVGRSLIAHELVHTLQQGEQQSLQRQPTRSAEKRSPKINYKKAEKANKRFADPDVLGWANKLETVDGGAFKAWADLWNASDYNSFADKVAQFQFDQGFPGKKIDGILGLESWARIGGIGEAMGGIERVIGEQCESVCTLATKQRIKRGYKMATGGTFSLAKDKDATTYNIILQSIEGRIRDVDKQYRGAGAAGAIVYAGIGTFVPEADIWNGGLRAGAALQVWKHRNAYELLQVGEIEQKGKKRRINSSDANFYGTSAVFVRYDDSKNPKRMLVRHFSGSEWWEKSDWAVWVAANVTTGGNTMLEGDE